MYKNAIISLLAVTVMETTGFIRPSNAAVYILAPILWYWIFLGTLQYIDYRVRGRKRGISV